MSFMLPPDWPQDPAKVEYAKYLQAYFSGRLPSKPAAFEPIGVSTGKVEDNKCVVNPGVKPKVMINQLIVGMAMAGIVRKNAAQRGVLVYHGTGSGKTGTSVTLMDAVWDLPDVRIVYVTSVDALASNPVENFYKLARNLIPRFQSLTKEGVKRAFDMRKVHFLSFAQLAHQLLVANPLKVTSNSQRREYQSFLKGALLIIDEVHGIFRPLPTQRKEHDALRRFLMDPMNPLTQGLRLAILTATPGDDVSEVIALLNMVRDPRSPTIAVPDVHNAGSMQAFKRRIQGLVSYLDMSSDTTRYPRLLANETYETPMSLTQFVKYLDAWDTDVSSSKGYTTTRKYNNMLYQYDPDLELTEFSAKIPVLLSNIDRFPRQKHYVYSTFGDRRGSGQGIYAIAHFLETELGYQTITLKEAMDRDWFKLKHKRRYVMVTNAELSGNTTSKRRADATLGAYLSIFNAPENRHGEFVQVMLSSQNYFQAMDLAAVRHIHIFEPFLSQSADLQAVGRGRRYCSHRDLLFDREWTVSVHRYISTMPLELKTVPLDGFKKRLEQLEAELEVERRKYTPDQERIAYLQEQLADAGWKDQARRLRMIDDIIREEVKIHSEQLLGVLRALQEASFDCRVFADMHGIKCADL